jgi:hypothetical protein
LSATSFVVALALILSLAVAATVLASEISFVFTALAQVSLRSLLLLTASCLIAIFSHAARLLTLLSLLALLATLTLLTLTLLFAASHLLTLLSLLTVSILIILLIALRTLILVLHIFSRYSACIMIFSVWHNFKI